MKTVRRKAKKRTYIKSSPWTAEEVAFLRKLFPHFDLICRLMPKHSEDACRKKAREIGLKRLRPAATLKPECRTIKKPPVLLEKKEPSEVISLDLSPKEQLALTAKQLACIEKKLQGRGLSSKEFYALISDRNNLYVKQEILQQKCKRKRYPLSSLPQVHSYSSFF